MSDGMLLNTGMSELSLRIAHAVVDGGKGYQAQSRADEGERLSVLAETVRALRGKKIDLLMFPAGFFQSRNRAARLRLSRRIRHLLNSIGPRFGVVVGVDEPFRLPRQSKVRGEKSDVVAGHPFFMLHRSAAGTFTWMQQVSVTRREGLNGELIDARWENRSLFLPGTSIAFLICGEAWSDVLMERVSTSGCRALAIAAHRSVNMHRETTGYGKLSWHRRLSVFSRLHQVPVVMAEHTRSPRRHRYAWPGQISALVAAVGAPTVVTLRFASV
jgi:hypothetical protein